MSAPLVLTVFESTKPRALTKRFELLEGELLKTSAAQMTQGTSTLTRCQNLHDFDTLMSGLTSAQALAYGISPAHPDAIIRSEKLRTGDAIARKREFFQFAPGPGVLMLDHDGTRDDVPIDADALRDCLVQAAPMLADAPMLWRPSASSCIVSVDGKHVFSGIKGQRFYVPVADATLIPKAGAALISRLWANGMGWVQVGKAGQALMRTLIDASVWEPERLDFAGPPILGTGLRRDPPSSRTWGDPAARFDLRALLTDAEVTAVARQAQANARSDAKQALAETRHQWIEGQAPTLAERRNIELDAAREVLQRAAEKQILSGDFVLTSQNGELVTVGDLLDDQPKWHGTRFADPLEPDYRDDNRIAWANLRSGSTPFIFSHAHGGIRYRLQRPSRRIQLMRGQRARVVDQILDVVRERGEVFDFGDGAAMARIARASATPVTRDWLTDYLERSCEFYTVKATDAGPKETVQDAPPGASMAILAKHGERRLPRLDAVVTAPTLRRDGSVLDEPGFDPESRLLYLNESGDVLKVPRSATPEEAVNALRRLWKPFRLFPFVDACDRAVMLASLLTAAMRGSLPTAPGFAFDAPSAGSGKTLLARALGILATGEEPSISSPAAEEEEMRKRLFASLREGSRVIVWDNLRAPLGGAALDSFLTAPTFTDRILGVSETARLPNRALFIATGNNVRLVGDTCRRLLLSRIDPRSEQPFAREFAFDPAATVAAQRVRFVVDCLTIIRAHITAGSPRPGKGRTASFETWDDLVRQPVIWVAALAQQRAEELPTFGDPLAVVDRQFDDDPETQKLTGFLDAWSNAFGNQPTAVAAAIERALCDAGLAAALDEIAGQQRSGVNRRMLGRWIERNRGRRQGGRWIERGKLSRGMQTWMVLGPKVGQPSVGDNPPQPTKPTTSPMANRSTHARSVVGMVPDGGSPPANRRKVIWTDRDRSDGEGESLA